MEKQKLTFRQRVAYADWAAKADLMPPGNGIFWFLIFAVIYLGVLLWFFEPGILSVLDYIGPHAMFLRFVFFVLLAYIVGIMALLTTYLRYFIPAFFEKDEAEHEMFLKLIYKKR